MPVIGDIIDGMTEEAKKGMLLKNGRAFYRGIRIAPEGTLEDVHVVATWDDPDATGDPLQVEVEGDYPSRFRGIYKAWESDWALHQKPPL